MGKLILLPGVDLEPPSRAELVAEISEMMMKEVASVFVEKQFEPGSLGEWHRQIRDYFWRVDIQLVNRDFRPQDVRRWTHHWRATALDYIGSKSVR
jgi:hypothetical protein